jgi:hypothetical protein
MRVLPGPLHFVQYLRITQCAYVGASPCTPYLISRSVPSPSLVFIIVELLMRGLQHMNPRELPLSAELFRRLPALPNLKFLAFYVAAPSSDESPLTVTAPFLHTLVIDFDVLFDHVVWDAPQLPNLIIRDHCKHSDGFRFQAFPNSVRSLKIHGTQASSIAPHRI